MKITVSRVTLPLTSVPFDTCSTPRNQYRQDRQLNVLARTTLLYDLQKKKLDSFSSEGQVHLHADACLHIRVKISCSKTSTCVSSQVKITLYKLQLMNLTELSAHIIKMAICVPCERFPSLSR